MDFEAALQKAFELGGQEGGSYHLEADELCEVIRAALRNDAGGDCRTEGHEPHAFASLNDWFLSQEPGRQAVLREDKWLLAGAAFEAGRAWRTAHAELARPFVGGYILVKRVELAAIAWGAELADPVFRSDIGMAIEALTKVHKKIDQILENAPVARYPVQKDPSQ